MPHDVGDLITLRTTFRSEMGVLTDPTAVVLTVVDAQGGTTAPAVSNTTTGTYSATYTCATPGVHYLTWAGTGALVATEHDTFRVRSEAESRRLSFPHGVQSWETAV